MMQAVKVVVLLCAVSQVCPAVSQSITFSASVSTIMPPVVLPPLGTAASVSKSASSSISTSLIPSVSLSTSVSLTISTSPKNNASISTNMTASQSNDGTASAPFAKTMSTSQSVSTSANVSLSISPSKSSSPSISQRASSSIVPQNENNMYPYGTKQGDNEFGLNDSPYYYYGHCLEIKTDRFGFPFFGERHYKLHICRNGKIQLNYEWSWWWPQKFGAYRWFSNMAIIAPFWGQTDEYLSFKANHSKVYYHVYKQIREDTVPSQTSEVFSMASQHVKRYDSSGKFSNFEATWVLVVTWEKLCPYVYYPYWYYWYNYEIPRLNCPGVNTFQAVIITNGLNTFLMYNYPKGGIQWVVPAIPSDSYYYYYWSRWYGLPVGGWNAGDDNKNYLNMKGSGTLFGMLNLDEKKGNTGLTGRYFWRIENSDGVGSLEKCFAWAFLQEFVNIPSLYDQHLRWDSRMACPCTEWQAWLDWGRFRWDWNSWPDYCYESRRLKYIHYYSPYIGHIHFRMTQTCCYSSDWQNWGALKYGAPDGGRVKVEAYYYRLNLVQTVYTDLEAYKHCCVDIPFCDLFYNYRPSDDCSRYEPPRRRWFWGDPHFKTLDGGNYTFNGLGEYVMIDAQNGTFQLQARTSLAQGNSTTATIFAAGAAKEENTSTVEVRVKKGGGISILIDQANYNNYNNLTNQSVSVGRNLSISKPEENCLDVSFPSTTSVKFCEKKEMLSFVVTPGDDYKNTTKGLLGTWNDNPDDDFTLPDGTVLPSSSTLREIHFEFGVKWQINQSQSLFTYAQNESAATFSKPGFEPMFADNITWHNDSLRLAAEAQCGEDYECLFDVASTNDLSVGSVTKDINVQMVNESNALGNFPPKLVNVPSSINATLDETVQLNITAEDNDTITFRVINKPTGATTNQSGNVLHFTWPVTSTRKFNLSFVATDDKGASATWSPTINMCVCHHGGQCVPPEEGDKVNTDSKFVYMGCACQGGYTGRFCDSDIDACEMNGQPCYAGVDCIDLPPPANSSGYQCGPCPRGYTGNGAQCADSDECQSNQSNVCAQVCVNTPGSFVCDCRDGYKLNADGKTCDDINECEQRNDCMQRCINTQGSYNCSCNQYFKTDPSDWRKCVGTNPCASDHGCSQICFKGSDDQPTCACWANYELESDGKTCGDINECDPAKSLHRCNQICENTQGSYKCACQTGFQLSRDGYYCEDINECMDEDLYNCTDEFHKCVNTRGSYKCECDRNLYFIDGKCRALAKNETVPTPTLPTPRLPTTKEREQAVQISISTKDNFEWDFKTDESFKAKMASVTSKFCNDNRTVCALKESRRKRRALFTDLYTADEVHLLPGYPSNASASLLVAFYVQQPLGLFIGNDSVLPGSTLLKIIVFYKPELEDAIGTNISDVKTLFIPTTASPTQKPVESSSNENWKWIAIGVSVGVVVLFLFIVIAVYCCMKKKRRKTAVKPFVKDSHEEPVEMAVVNWGPDFKH